MSGCCTCELGFGAVIGYVVMLAVASQLWCQCCQCCVDGVLERCLTVSWSRDLDAHCLSALGCSGVSRWSSVAWSLDVFALGVLGDGGAVS